VSGLDLKSLIREVPDYPKPGIKFYDLTTLLARPEGLKAAVDGIAERFRGTPVDMVAGIEARGFILAAAIAYERGVGLLPIRKPGKLPWKTSFQEYELEYGKGRLEIHQDGALPGQNILIIDDVLATGGTAKAAAQLVQGLGAKVAGYGFLVELGFLGGRKKLGADEVFSLVHYE
jgi:adenine phosphoribosyltransferase